jgi:putative transposase
VILSVLFFAASRMRSIYDACQRLRHTPSDETVRQALLATLPPQKDLEARLNAALGDRLPKPFFRRGQRVAVDFTLIPYHGKPHREKREVYRGQPKHGTTHFHAYATAYVAQHGQRYTLAMTYVFGDETVKEVLKRLMQQVQKLGVKVRFLLLDKGFFNAEVVRYLQAARYPFLMPAFARARRPKRPKPQSLHDYAARKRSGWGRYSWINKQGRRATVSIAIVCRNYRGQRGRHGRRTQLYAYWGLRPVNARWVYETYRKRFGIETSYRQMNEARIRTSTRNPLLRLLFVGLALILRNVWVWCHLHWLAERRGPGILIHDEILRLREMTLWLQHLVENEFELRISKAIPIWRHQNDLAIGNAE